MTAASRFFAAFADAADCFNERGFISLEIPEGVVKIGNGAFSSCSSLEEVIIPRSVREIGSMTFLACRSLKSAVIPSGTVDIGDMAFPETTELICPK
ncbi:MAG: leucine-rich repeat domain-containing protein [Clostridiales bacterium]|nr:leucine-rich repeat domain-containing protein [Clostridiales bacterium]